MKTPSKSCPKASPSKSKGSSCLKVIKFLLAAFPSVVFGVFTIVFTVQQHITGIENRKQDQKQADEQNIRSTFENYIDDISNLLLDEKFNRSNSEHLLHIRVKTLTTLRHVDINRKRDIILFLYESRLLRNDVPCNERLSLQDADLDKLTFQGSSSNPIQLDNLYLPGVYLSNAVFHWCILDYAVFDNSSMANVRFINSSISHVTFRRIYAPDAIMGDLVFHENDFTGSMLVRTSFVGGTDWKEEVDLTNTDLLDSRGNHGQLINWNSVPENVLILVNARLPNGSFHQINSTELISDGGAELGCQINLTENTWKHGPYGSKIILSPISTHPSISISSSNENCYFLADSLNASSLSQLIDVHSFSVLIHSEQARYNMSAYLTCSQDKSSEAWIKLVSLKNNYLWIDSHKGKQL
ncbi:unnamed protein product [Adineta ricciae]|uniref:Uncharacterized protein n=1 Tax=Adineta ricciae TaxID=249248 RepID=A0A815ETU9_ADIRI|nr:unnamed protein product [Adineta ricciae]